MKAHRRIRIVLCGLGVLGLLAVAPIRAEAFSLFGLFGGSNATKEEQAAQPQPDKDDLVAGLIQDLLPAEAWEKRGRKLILESYEAQVAGATVYNIAATSAGVVGDTIKQIKAEQQEITLKAGDALEQYHCVLMEKKKASDAIEKAKYEGNATAQGQSQDDAFDLPGMTSDLSTNATFPALKELHRDVKRAKNIFSSKNGEYRRMLSKRSELFIEKIFKPASYNLVMASELIGISLQEFDDVYIHLDNVRSEVKKEGMEVTKDGVKMVAFLLIKQGKIMDILKKLASNPIANCDKINELRPILSKIMFFIKTIQRYNEIIEKSNTYLDNLSATMSKAKSEFEGIKKDSDAVVMMMLDAIKTQYPHKKIKKS